VENLSLVSTSILTIDNQKLVVPDSKIWSDVIKNVTDQDIRRVDMVFGISYSDDIPRAEKVLEDILAGNERVLEHPEPMVRLHNLGDSSVDFVVRPWVKTEDYWEVFWETRTGGRRRRRSRTRSEAAQGAPTVSGTGVSGACGAGGPARQASTAATILSMRTGLAR
jgi:small-conductance mechanosensitive channel